MQSRIVYILPHPPAYHYLKQSEQAPVNFDTPSGSWIGIWENDFGDLFGKEILKIDQSVKYEMWRPDFRADRVYSHTFESGIKHVTFPAHTIKMQFGMKRLAQLSSPLMLQYIERLKGEGIILHLNTLGDYLNREIVKRFPEIPKVINFHGIATSIPAHEMMRIRKNMAANLAYFIYHKQLKRNEPVIFVYQNSHGIKTLFQYDPLGVERIFTGVDFTFYKKGFRSEAKRELDIRPETIMFLMASRFEKLKQIDRIIDILTALDENDRHDFMLVIAGRGKKEDEEYLHEKARHLESKNKVKFVGYRTGNELLKMYQAADLFISASVREGGPTSVTKAIACETPIFCTRVGGIDDILAQYQAGILVGNNDYKRWKSEIKAVLEGKKEIRPLDHGIAEDLFNWPSAASRYLEIYNRLDCYKKAM